MKFSSVLSPNTLPKRIVASIRAFALLLYFKPVYLAIAVTSSVVFYEIIFWVLNIGLFQYLMTTEYLSFWDKLDIVGSSYSGVFTVPFAPLAATLFAVSVLQGVSVAALVYSIRHERATNRSILKNFGGTGVAGVLSVLGLGCAACGTSLVTPILTFFFATSSVAVVDKVGMYSAVFALVVSVITAYLSGLKLSTRLVVPSK